MRATIIGAAVLCAGAAPAVADTAAVMRPTIGCYSKPLMEQAQSGGDVRGALMSGECRALRPGERVVSLSEDIGAGLTRIQPQDDSDSLWVDSDALDDDD